MTDKELAEIRRRYKSDKTSISRVRGCYVNDKNEIVAEFDQSLGLMSEDEIEFILGLLKKSISGANGKNIAVRTVGLPPCEMSWMHCAALSAR